uniref:PLAT domain-containing protein n=5 Tax=Octopus bimaculoides TaxID=37653 RepID=A0A0L8GJJ2_OCTBM|eukprot:XP_014780785.1 PREDICTED: polycystic kidney disease protein 1-like 2 [Octopus bimaculoides]
MPGEPAVKLESKLFTILGERKTPNGLNNSVLGSGCVKLPTVDNLLPNGLKEKFVDTKFLRAKSNPYRWDPTSMYINSDVVSLDLYSPDGSAIPVSNISQDISIDIEVKYDSPLSSVTLNSTFNKSISIHSLEVPTVENSLLLLVKPELANVSLDVLIRHKLPPTDTEYDLFFTVPIQPSNDQNTSDSDYTVFVTSEQVKQLGNGTYFIGIRPFSELTEQSVDDYYDALEMAPADVQENITADPFPSYQFRFIVSGCRFWDTRQEKWLTKGCRVSPESTRKYTRCLCNHLTSFGTDFFVPVNKINFDTVFLNLDEKLKDNFAVLAMLCSVFSLYFMLIIWARRQDKRDLLKWGVVPLKSNKAKDCYFYTITVFTGVRKGAGTLSRIGFVLTGELGDTGIRQLVDEKESKVFSRGSINPYLLGVPKSLGPLTYLRIWHDASGKGEHESWYLRKVHVKDLQSSKTCVFLCNRWLAVEYDDGLIERVLPVAAPQDIKTFQNLFFSKTHKSFSDDHLWLSVFMRPTHSNFTRVQRISSILSVVLMTMLANAVFYKSGSEATKRKYEFTIVGSASINLQALYISFISCLIVLPVNIAVDQLFRKSRPKTNLVSSIWGKQLEQTKQQPNINQLNSPNILTEKANSSLNVKMADQLRATSALYSRTPTILCEDNQAQFQALSPVFPMLSHFSNCEIGSIRETYNISKETMSSKKQSKCSKDSLPHGCIYIGWLLVFANIGTSAFLTFSYSMEWGKEKSNAWLTSMFMSLGESITVIQPTKIVILSLITSLLLKKPEEENYEEKKGQERLGGAKSPVGNDQIGVHIITDLHNDEELVDYQPEKESINATPIYTPNKEVLKKLRQSRLKDIKMKQLIKDMCFYLTYLVLLIILASNNRDPRSYIIKDTLLNVLQAKHLPKVIRYAQFWKWTKEVVVPQTYTSTLANGKNATPQDFQMLSCGSGYRVGPVRLRQLRVRAGKCHALSKFHTTRENCNQDYSFHTEDTTNYTTSWKELQHGDNPIKLPLNSGWRYRHYTEIGGIPIVGEKAVYSSNGYCKDLTGSPSRAMAALDELIKLRWLDENTRAIFVEFTLYNPNINMFTTVTVMFETPTLGGMASNVIINTFRLYPYTGNYGIFILIVEIICIIFIIIFIEQKIQTVRRLQMKCFSDFWNILQILNLCFSIIAATTYVMRHLFTISAINTVKKLRGDFYNFQQLSFWSDVFTIFLALAIFLTILNVIHLLRFNRRMSMLSQTLRQSSKDLFAFSFVFAVLFFSYACVGYLLFGKVITSYSSISISIMTLFMSILGQYQYESVQAVNHILGPIYFFSCTMLVNFILFSVFITILNETFSLVRSNISKQINDYEIIDYIHEHVTKWIGTDHDHLFNKLLNKKTDNEVTYVRDSTNKMNQPNEQAHEEENIDTKIHDIFKRLDALYLQIGAEKH